MELKYFHCFVSRLRKLVATSIAFSGVIAILFSKIDKIKILGKKLEGKFVLSPIIKLISFVM
jgi:hypothetical protein